MITKIYPKVNIKDGKAQEFIDKYAPALDLEVHDVMRYKDAQSWFKFPFPITKENENYILGAAVSLGDSSLTVSDDITMDPITKGQMELAISLKDPQSVDQGYQFIVDDGGEDVIKPFDSGSNDMRHATARDKFGITWALNFWGKEEKK